MSDRWLAAVSAVGSALVIGFIAGRATNGEKVQTLRGDRVAIVSGVSKRPATAEQSQAAAAPAPAGNNSTHQWSEQNPACMEWLARMPHGQLGQILFKQHDEYRRKHVETAFPSEDGQTQPIEAAMKLQEFKPLLTGQRFWIAKGGIELEDRDTPVFFSLEYKQETKGAPDTTDDITYFVNIRIPSRNGQSHLAMASMNPIRHLRKLEDQYYVTGSFYRDNVPSQYSYVAIGIPYQGNRIGKIQLLEEKTANWVSAPSIHWINVTEDQFNAFEKAEDPVIPGGYGSS